MKSHARVVVIGGGVVGCSVLYHLTKLGWKDVILVERKELTAGSTWHAAGGFHALNSDINVSRLQAYTIDFYDEIRRISGEDTGIHFTGGLNFAATPERWDFLKADRVRSSSPACRRVRGHGRIRAAAAAHNVVPAAGGDRNTFGRSRSAEGPGSCT